MAHVALAYKGSSWTYKYAYPLMLLQTLIGNYNHSAGSNVLSGLCTNVANGEFANLISTFNMCYKDTGLFCLYAVTEREKTGDIVACIARNLAGMADAIVDKNVECAKIAFKAAMLVGLDGNTNVCKDIGRQLPTYGRRLTPADIFLRIEELTADEVRAAAHGIFHNRDHAMVVVGGLWDCRLMNG
jgi:processing peptidase subunit beta